MRRSDRVDSLLACISLNCSLLRRETERVRGESGRYTAIQYANLVVLALLIEFVLLVVFYKSIASCDACCDYFRE